LSPLGFGKNLITAKTGSTKPRLVSVMDAESEAEMIAEEIQTRLEQGRSLKGNAVLFRAARHSNHLELELTRWRIAFKKFGGQTFTEAAHIKDLLAVLRLAENPADMMSGLRVLELLEGVGAVTARKLFHSTTPDDFVGCLKRCVPPAGAREAWPDFLALMRSLYRDKIGWPAEVDAVRNWLVPMLPRLYIDDPAERAMDLEQLQSMASSFKSRVKFLTDLTLDPPTKNKRVGLARPATEEESDEFVTLSTTHAAKGLQWRSVYVLNVTEGGFPSSRAETEADIEEERRLLYVAMTRAESELTLTVPLRVDGPGGFGDGEAIGRRSRFVPDKILRHFDVGTWRADQDDDDEECVPSRSPKAEIAARIQGRWGD
jgi:DNA helicase II / ATP-dependent DNA helicase PcrA